MHWCKSKLGQVSFVVFLALVLVPFSLSALEASSIWHKAWQQSVDSSREAYRAQLVQAQDKDADQDSSPKASSSRKQKSSSSNQKKSGSVDDPSTKPNKPLPVKQENSSQKSPGGSDPKKKSPQKQKQDQKPKDNEAWHPPQSPDKKQQEGQKKEQTSQKQEQSKPNPKTKDSSSLQTKENIPSNIPSSNIPSKDKRETDGDKESQQNQQENKDSADDKDLTKQQSDKKDSQTSQQDGTTEVDRITRDQQPSFLPDDSVRRNRRQRDSRSSQSKKKKASQKQKEQQTAQHPTPQREDGDEQETRQPHKKQDDKGIDQPKEAQAPKAWAHYRKARRLLPAQVNVYGATEMDIEKRQIGPLSGASELLVYLDRRHQNNGVKPQPSQDKPEQDNVDSAKAQTFKADMNFWQSAKENFDVILKVLLFGSILVAFVLMRLRGKSRRPF